MYLHVNAGVVLFLFISVFSIVSYFLIKGREEHHLIPEPRFSIVGFADILIEATYNMIHGTLGHDTKKYFPFVASLFIFILFGNLMGLIPFSAAPTSDLNMSLALGAATFVYFNVMGIKAHGLKGYLEHYLMGLGLVIGLPVAILEMISHLLRPLTLGLRLALNLKMDHTIVHTFADLVAWLVPVPLLLFGIVVCTIQAFVFATLTAVYIQLATEHESH